MTDFSKILIANRGEIACRVIRTARSLGYHTVAVYSDADKASPHVNQADEAVHIGGSAASDSYLNVETLLRAVRRTGADAVHPGYGFLSENAGFARACLDHGVVFIGPPPAAIEAMGNKALAKQRMMAAGVPCVPGYLGTVQDNNRLADEALKLGFPLLLKAVAGGGGRGMRLVRDAAELSHAIADARREAQSAFGDGTLMLERFVGNSRHIEIQIFADAHGNAVYLGERDCTTQRRRQKVIEEAPSPVVSSALREAMGRDAVAAALAVGYRGAGTVEFIVDAELRHYFLEMNTRLQVEHPVTEMVTGFDLVAWQLRIAAGRPLPVKQSDVKLSGHAIEARLYAEDPYADFAPQTGTVRWWRPQNALQAGVRVDSGIAEGDVVAPFYDPMLAKVIVHGHDRDDAIRRLRKVLADTPLLGLQNNRRFLSDVLNHPDFRGLTMTTTTLDQWMGASEAVLQRPQPGDGMWYLAAAVFAMERGAGWRSISVSAVDVSLQCNGNRRDLRVHTDRVGGATVQFEGQQQTLKLSEIQDGNLRYEVDGVICKAVAVMHQRELHLASGSTSFVFSEPSSFPKVESSQDATSIRAPVAGRVTQMRVAAGDNVVQGQALLCVEAMKMEMWLTAKATGSVRAVYAQMGEQVESGTIVVELMLHEAS